MIDRLPYSINVPLSLFIRKLKRKYVYSPAAKRAAKRRA